MKPSARLPLFTIGMIAINVFAVCVAVIQFLDIYDSLENSRLNYTEAAHGLDIIGDMQYQTQEARRTLLYALATDDSNLQVMHADQSRAADAEVAGLLDQYEGLMAGVREGAAVEKLSQDWARFLILRDELITTMLEGDARTAVARDQKEGVPAFNAVRMDLEMMKSLLKQNAGELLERAGSFQHALLRMAFLLGTLAVIAGVSVVMVQSRSKVDTLRASEARLKEDFERVRAEEHAIAELLSAVLRAATEYSIIGTDPDGFISVFNRGAQLLLGYEGEEVLEVFKPDAFHDPVEIAARAAVLGMAPGFDVLVAAAREGEAETREWTYVRKDGSRVPVTVTVTAMRDPEGVLLGFIAIAADISARLHADAELRELHEKLLLTSRQAGMAEVATGVLHNVGNVLNSVNVSGNLINERLRASKVADLARVARFIDEHRADFAGFVTRDPRGVMIPELVSRVSAALLAERDALVSEVECVTKNIGHIKEIVSMQQSFARMGGHVEMKSVESLIEDAVQINSASLTRHHIKIVKEYEPVPDVLIDTHKVLQILVNLIRNAKQALESTDPAARRIVLRIARKGDKIIVIQVKDTGMGIEPGNLKHIFSQGFTTKKNGHGFGLHSGALAAQEMGGTLRADSPGPGKGAVFTLEIPVTLPPPVTGLRNAGDTVSEPALAA